MTHGSGLSGHGEPWDSWQRGTRAARVRPTLDWVKTPSQLGLARETG
jgi:hypothetical protein